MSKILISLLWALPALCFAAIAVFILVDLMGTDLIFALHPLLMSTAFVLCFSYGIVTYRLEVLEAQLGVQKPIDRLRESHRHWQVKGGLLSNDSTC